MIDRQALSDFVEQKLKDTGCFLTDVKVTPDNQITVEIDSMNAVDIDECVSLTRAIEAEFDRDKEDYELEVGSAGITSDFKIRAQYTKNIGNDVEVLTRDGRKLHGVLTAVAPGEPSDHSIGFTVEIPVKVKEPGAKKPVIRQEALQFTSDDCKYVRYDLKF